MSIKLASLLLVALASAGARTQADPISEYQVNGTISIPGNSTYSSVVEAVNFSFEVAYSNSVDGIVAGFVGTPSFTGSGPLGTTFSSEFTSATAADGLIYLFSSSAEIDLNLLGIMPGQLGPPAISGYADVYACYTLIACAEFYPDNLGGAARGSTFSTATGLFQEGTVTGNVAPIPTPEPTTLCLFGLGALAFLGLIKCQLKPNPSSSSGGYPAVLP